MKFAMLLSLLLSAAVFRAGPAEAKSGKKRASVDTAATGASTATLAPPPTPSDSGSVAVGSGAAPALARPNVGLLARLLPRLTAEQGIFDRFFEKAEYEAALFQWPSAFGDTVFGESATGRALGAYVLFENGVKVAGLEALLAIGDPQNISPLIMKLWKTEVPADDVNWTYVNPRLWKPAWTAVLGPVTEVRVRGHQTFTSDQRQDLRDLIRKSPPGSAERAWLAWQSLLVRATEADAGADDSAGAAKELAELMKAPKNPVSRDLMTLTAGRMLYQAGYLDAAIKYDSQVTKSSDDWFDAQEEMAWAQLRKGAPQDAIATTKTLVLPAFAALIGPEAVFVRALALLKVCDYPEAMKVLGIFRDEFRPRAQAMLEVAETGNTAAVQAFTERVKKTGPLRQIDLGPLAAKLPRFASRDENLAHLLLAEAEFENEANLFKDLYGRSISGGSAKIGFQGRLEQMRRDLDTRVKSARAASYFRIKALAQDEFDEIAQTLQKMHIVEAEVLQQIALSGRVIGSTAGEKSAVDRKGSTGSQSRDRLTFPDDGETWFDELANYQVDLQKGCQSAKRSSEGQSVTR